MTILLQKAGLLPANASCQDLIGDDAVVRVVNDDLAIIENVDVFTPIHDDPYVQGQIVACNATNDVFAMGATDIISLQAFLAYPNDLPEEIPVGILQGMKDFMQELGSGLSGGQTIKNPVPVFGGIALGVAKPNEVVYSSGAKPGDVAVLTKPLGIQPAMRSYRDLRDAKRDALLESFTESALVKMQNTAVRLMIQRNLEVAQAMKIAKAHAATDITGFGLLGHAGNVAALSCVDIVIEQVPVIPGSIELANYFGHQLAQGLGAETAGGMLVFLAPENVGAFEESLNAHGLPCWPIGKVTKLKGEPTARLTDDVEFIETDFP